MPKKGYAICLYRSISDPAALAEYGQAAIPAIQAAGGKFLAVSDPTKIYEAGKNLRAVIVEFDSVQKAIAAVESPGYQAALRLLKGTAERDVRIVEAN
jgi:uncharacterized protein (DUF1330 family)